jgi:hypothetical protein
VVISSNGKTQELARRCPKASSQKEAEITQAEKAQTLEQNSYRMFGSYF